LKGNKNILTKNSSAAKKSNKINDLQSHTNCVGFLFEKSLKNQ
jgi:hypothetical protein